MNVTASRRPPTLAELRARRDEILSVARRYGASNLRVFGSVAREEPANDVDILIDLDEGAACSTWRGSTWSSRTCSAATSTSPSV